MSEHRTMPITPSRWQYQKFKDLLHFYTLIGLFPVTAIVFYTNVFIGPAKLAETPEGYVPKHWEYYKHPITRFLARYVFTPPQQEYEKYMHVLYEEDEKMKMSEVNQCVFNQFILCSDSQKLMELCDHFWEVNYSSEILTGNRALEKKVKDLMEERADYQAYYYKPISGKYVRQGKRFRERLEESSGVALD